MSVGDEEFSQKSRRPFQRFADEKKTIIFISHNLPLVRDFCTKAMWLNKGKFIGIGNPTDITNTYNVSNK